MYYVVESVDNWHHEWKRQLNDKINWYSFCSLIWRVPFPGHEIQRQGDEFPFCCPFPYGFILGTHLLVGGKREGTKELAGLWYQIWELQKWKLTPTTLPTISDNSPKSKMYYEVCTCYLYALYIIVIHSVFDTVQDGSVNKISNYCYQFFLLSKHD